MNYLQIKIPRINLGEKEIDQIDITYVLNEVPLLNQQMHFYSNPFTRAPYSHHLSDHFALSVGQSQSRAHLKQ